MTSDSAHFIQETRLRRARMAILVDTAFGHAREHMAEHAIQMMLREIKAACNPLVYDPIACEESAMAYLKIAGQILGLQDWRRP